MTQKLFMQFSNGGRVSRAAPRPMPASQPAYAQPSVTPQQAQAEGKRTAIRKMMNVYEKKQGGGCGSCSGAK
jgi:hypothetical protein